MGGPPLISGRSNSAPDCVSSCLSFQSAACFLDFRLGSLYNPVSQLLEREDIHTVDIHYL